MKIFDKRPLSLILCMLLGGFVFFSSFDTAGKIVIASIGSLILLFAIFVPLEKITNRSLCMVCAVTLLVGCLFSFVYFDLYFFIDDDFKDDVEISGVVTEYDSFSYGRDLTIKIETINGNKCRARTAKAFATLDESENVSEGSRIRLIGKIA